MSTNVENYNSLLENITLYDTVVITNIAFSIILTILLILSKHNNNKPPINNTELLFKRLFPKYID